MSFEPNDMNTIHLGNYEEFFILYMDNELSEDQVKMVDQFLIANPDLRSEFEILLSTKLPLEDFSFDKNDVLAENIKLSLVDEELLLYIDNELPSDKKKTVELELAANEDYQLQHQVLLQTKLDPSEKITYLNKKELYHSTERVVSMKVWMRVAAAAVVIVIGGIVYFKNPPSITSAGIEQPMMVTTTTDTKNESNQAGQTNVVEDPSQNPVNNNVAVNIENKKEKKSVTRQEQKQTTLVPNNDIVRVEQQKIEELTLERPKVRNVHFDESEKIIALNAPSDNLNTGAVTSLSPARTTIKGPDETITQTDNDRKGSLKGFLRKATRVIEKRTGIDPTNSNGELLIGAVAINLK